MERNPGLFKRRKMQDQDKTKKKLIDELVELRQRVIKLEKAEMGLKQAEELLEKERETLRSTFLEWTNLRA